MMPGLVDASAASFAVLHPGRCAIERPACIADLESLALRLGSRKSAMRFRTTPRGAST